LIQKTRAQQNSDWDPGNPQGTSKKSIHLAGGKSASTKPPRKTYPRKKFHQHNHTNHIEVLGHKSGLERDRDGGIRAGTVIRKKGKKPKQGGPLEGEG